MRADLAHVENWIFDLDNSLYPASVDLFALIDAKMTQFVGRLLDVEPAEALRIQKSFYREHGTTLAGLMRNHDIDPREFLEFVHDIDMARLVADPVMLAGLDRLPGRKFVFTNGDEGYARRVLDRLGLANAFDGLHDIHAMGYVPKPDPHGYAQICAAHDIDPSRALFVDDMARNLPPAKALGMVTVWVDNGSDHGNHNADMSRIDHVTHDVADWLTGIFEPKISGGDKR